MSSLELSFRKIDIATGKMDEMVAFYRDVFEVEFKEIGQTMGGVEWKLYLGLIGALKFFLAPSEPSGTTAGQAGVHQFHVQTNDLDGLIERAERFGCTVDSVPYGEGKRNVCLRDPDGHPWIVGGD